MTRALDDDLLARHRAVLPSWQSLYYEEPLELVSGSGCRVRAADGREYLDFFAGILVAMVGHGAPEVTRALAEQAETGLLHTSTLYLHRAQVELAERIAALSRIPDAKVFFTTSGSEANEAALLMATTARRSNVVLALRGSYHGRSFATVGVTGNRSWSPTSYSGLQVAYAMNGHRYRSPLAHLSDAGFCRAAADDLRELLATATAGDVACMIAEPLQGVGGYPVPPDGFLAAYAEVLREHGILFVSDEVQTGWGRTGDHLWGVDAHGVTPDAITFAKGIGNGLALAGVVGRADLVDSVSARSISTFGGNPLAARAGLAVLSVLERDDLQGNARRVGARLLHGLRAASDGLPLVGEVRGRGLLLGMEVVEPGTTTPAPAQAGRVLEETRARGLLVGLGGLHGNVLRVAPPLVVTQEEADEGLGVLREALHAAAAVPADARR